MRRLAVPDGIVYVTEDRKLEGFFETMSIAANINMGLMATRGSITNVVNMAEARRAADEWIKALDIKTINRNAKPDFDSWDVTAQVGACDRDLHFQFDFMPQGMSHPPGDEPAAESAQ